jgi:hypothetical protein
VNVAIDQPEHLEGGAAEATPCMALVPMSEPVHPPPSAERLTRPDPSFVTQLIATAEHAPQTCALRRATPAVAHAAYGIATSQTQIRIPGREVQQII